MEFEEEYQDVLQNIEVVILGVYRRNPEMMDYDVERALQALQRAFRAENQGKDAPVVALTEIRQKLYDAVEVICNWRLGKAALSDEGSEVPSPPPITLDEILACLKRIEKSVKFWNKKGGIRGYLTYIGDYVM